MDHLDFEDLAALERRLGALRSSEVQRDFGIDLMVESLERTRAVALEHALEEEGPVDHLDLALARDHAELAGLEISTVAGVLSSVQSALAGIAQALVARPTRRGVIPAEIQALVSLRLSVAVPGSLTLRLAPTEPDLEQEPLFVDGEESLLESSVTTMLGVLASDVEEDLLQYIAAVGPRATGHLRELVRQLGESHTVAEFRWQSSRTSQVVAVNVPRAMTLSSRLSAMETREETLVLTGVLVGANIARRRFELEAPGEAISGDVAPDAAEKLTGFFGMECTATVLMRESSAPSGETQRAYTLLALQA